MPSLNVPQSQFLLLPHKFRAFVAGFGSGKTWGGCSALSKHFMEWPGVNAGYFAPTYPQIRDIFYPTMEEVAYDWGLKTKINQANHEVHIYSGRQYRGTVICRSMEKPQTIVGFKVGHALVDELDVLTSIKAQQAWRKKNGVDVTTTPEGFKFIFLQFVKQLRDKPALRGMYGLIQASTFDNELNLPDDYIASLMESYPEQLIRAYLNGQFVNLTSGSIYHAYDRKLNQCFDTVLPGEPLFIGMDFNVGKMAAMFLTLTRNQAQPRAGLFCICCSARKQKAQAYPGRFREYIQRESTSFAAWAFDRSLRLRSQLKNACTGCKNAASTHSSMMVKMAISGRLSCENMVGYSCRHYVGTRRLDALSHACDERMFILGRLNCATEGSPK